MKYALRFRTRTTQKYKGVTRGILVILLILICGVSIATMVALIDKRRCEQVKALEQENAAQWKRISELEVLLCNPELLDCK